MSLVVEYTLLGEDGEETIVKMPAKWVICPACDGHGTDRGASVESDGGGFTSSEWNDLDQEFRDDYLNGVYDKPCTSCKGRGR
jgi:hypothetical protein